MTVKDLIAELGQFDENLALVRDDGEPVRFIHIDKTVGVFNIQDEGLLIRFS